MINNILEVKLIKPNSFFGVTIHKGNLHIIFNYYTVKNAVELFFAFHPDVEKIQYH
jgi:hypothetical protein